MPPSWVPENRIEELVRSYGHVSPEIDAEFYRELLNADVVTLGRPSDPSKVSQGYQLLSEDKEFRIQLLDHKGEPVVAMYSSLKRMTDVIPEEYYRGTGFVQLRCESLLKIMMASDPNSKFALNPGHMIVKTFSPDEVNALLSGAIFKELEEARVRMNTPKPFTIPKGSQFLVGRPKVVPTNLMEKLATHFQSSGSVEQAWMGQILIPSSGQPPQLLLCIRLAKNPQKTYDQVLVDMGPIIRSALGKTHYLTVSDASGEGKAWLDRLILFFPNMTS